MRTLVLIALLTACGGDTSDSKDTNTDTPVSTSTPSTTDTTTATTTTTTTTAPCDGVTCANGTCDDSSGDAICVCDDGFHGDLCDLTTVWAPTVGETEVGSSFMDVGRYTRSHIWANREMTLPDVPMEVTTIRFRRTELLDGSSTLVIPEVTVLIGTGHPDFPMMDETFDSYFIGDQREVFSGQVNLPSVSASPLAFDAWEITISPPFPYDPSTGRLAIELQIPGAPLADSIAFDCNNDASNYMLMTSDAFMGTAPPANGNNATGCAPMMELELRY